MILSSPEFEMSAKRRDSGLLRRLFAVFDSVWLGIGLASVLFIYCSIGSGFPWVRQLPAFEMTEFQWFHWWPFSVLNVLLCMTMATVTIRRIPLRLVNAGVWTIHTGVVVLVLGSWYYFGTKVEGDAPVFRRHVRIEAPGATAPTNLLALPGAEAVVRVGADSWKFDIQSTNSDWPLLSDGREGERTHAINVQVTPPDGEPFVRQLLAGYPEYTEDVLPGKGRAIKTLGRKLVDEQLKLMLEYEPQTTFHVMSTWALFVRRVGDTEWIERKIQGLPRYTDHVASREHVFSDSPIRPRPLDIEVPPAAGGDALSRASVRVTGYLGYAQMDREWRDGGEQLNPVAKVSLISDRSAPATFELMALDPTHSVGAEGTVQFVWLDDAAALGELPTDSRAVLGIRVPSANVALELPISSASVSPDGPFQPIEGTEFSYRVTNLQDRLLIPGSTRSVSIAFVDVKTPEGQFTRWVADRPEVSRDVPLGDDAHGAMAAKPAAVDPRIQMTYRPSTAPVIVAGYPQGLRLIFNGRGGRAVDREIRVGEPAEILDGLQVRVDGLWARAVPETKPRIVPENSRQQKVDEAFSMIRLEVDSGRGVDARWLRFNAYALPNEDYAYAGRFSYLPERFRLADGSFVEVLFSRERMALPAPIALEEFELDTHIGGYTGSVSTIRNYVSQLRFYDGARWTDPTPIAVNQPTDFGGFWYFQSSWDRPPGTDANGGMNYTGLGIGNRNGVYVQLAGCCLMVAGLIFAFYVKPVLKRRRTEHQRERVGVFQGEFGGPIRAGAFETVDAVRT